MSSLIVEVSKIQKVLPHPNAERLELAHVKGWQCVVPKSRYAPGNLVTYIPPDSVLPAELSDRLGITKYLSNGAGVAARQAARRTVVRRHRRSRKPRLDRGPGCRRVLRHQEVCAASAHLVRRR